MPAVTVKVNDSVLKSVISRMPMVGTYISEAAAVNAFNHARLHVPVDTGALRASIFYRVEGHGAWVGATMHYAGFVEMGTRKMGARPYLRPAVKQIPWMKIIKAAFARVGL